MPEEKRKKPMSKMTSIYVGGEKKPPMPNGMSMQVEYNGMRFKPKEKKKNI